MRELTAPVPDSLRTRTSLGKGGGETLLLRSMRSVETALPSTLVSTVTTFT
jgi:hypothetical protein